MGAVTCPPTTYKSLATLISQLSTAEAADRDTARLICIYRYLQVAPREF
jgi:hypothetical protein